MVTEPADSEGDDGDAQGEGEEEAGVVPEYSDEPFLGFFAHFGYSGGALWTRLLRFRSCGESWCSGEFGRTLGVAEPILCSAGAFLVSGVAFCDV